MTWHFTGPELPMKLAAAAVFLLLIFAAPSLLTGRKLPPAEIKTAPLNAEQVVSNLVRMNALRAERLQAYEGTRTYRLQYRGFPGNRDAEMHVSVKYLRPLTKAFTVVSATGSKVVIDRVFKKLLESEQEALGEDNQKATALNTQNYDFTLLGFEPATSTDPSRYVMQIEPRKRNKFLYRGRIWIDGQDFAVVKIQAEPAKSPSFWTKHSEIEHSYEKVGDFWLPAHNYSVSTIRLGGRAVLTIDYNEYRITDRLPLGRPELSVQEQK